MTRSQPTREIVRQTFVRTGESWAATSQKIRQVESHPVKLDRVNRKTFALLFGFIACLPACRANASDYAARRAAATKQCEAISPGDYQTGLAFNPDGYRSYYVQSECFQKAAEQFRDSSLCGRVRRRFSLFWSSWGVSEKQCHDLVERGIGSDRQEIEKEKQNYTAGPVRLQNFRIGRNGNGRDFDLIPQFSSGYAHGYHLTFEIIDVSGGPILIHSDGYYLDAHAQIRVFVRQADIRARFADFALNHPYKVRATATLSIGMGGPSGYWSDEFLESIFPARERSQSLTIESKF